MNDLYTESGAADLFTSKHGDSIRYDHTTKRWLLWDEKKDRWDWDHTLMVQHLVTEVCREIAGRAARDPQLRESQRDQIATRFCSWRVISGVLLLLKMSRVHACALKRKPKPNEDIYPPRPSKFAAA